MKEENYTSVKAISFLFPVVGLIIYAVNIGSNPKLAKIALRWVLYSFAVSACIVLLIIVIPIIISLISFLFYSHNYREEGTTTERVIEKEYITMDDYEGMNYLEVKGKIQEQFNCTIIVETEKNEMVKQDTVIYTIPRKGEMYEVGKDITIVIPAVDAKYPDFTNGYTIDEIEEFCKKYELNLKIEYKADSAKENGEIIKQSRAKDTSVVPGSTIIITVVKND